MAEACESGSQSSSSASDYRPSARSTSDVWNHFTRLKESRQAQCKLCDKKLAYHGGTSNLRNHLLQIHPLHYKKDSGTSDSRQQTLKSMLKSTTPCTVTRSKEIQDKIVRMIVLDMRPINMVECSGFRELISTLEPGYTMPSRKTVKNAIVHLHEQGKLKLKELLADAPAVSLTTDIWSSITNESYLTVTAHWLSDEWEMCCAVLQTGEFSTRHTGVNIADELLQAARYYNIAHKVFAVVHDEASNMQLSLGILHDSQQYEGISCNAHRLQLCLKNGFEIAAIDRMIKCGSKVVGHFKLSPLATNELRKRQLLMNVTQKKLIQNCTTRWNSTYYMLDRLLEMRWPISAVLSDETVTKRSDRYLDLTNEHWSLAEELIKVLKPFEVATNLFCYDKQSTISCILPVLQELLQHLESSEDDSKTIAAFKKTVRTEIKERWQFNNLESTSCMVLSSALDPRFKPLKFIKEEEMENIKLHLVSQISNLPIYQDHGYATEEEPPPTKKSAMEIIFGGDDDSSLTSHSADSPTDEVTQFIAEKAVSKSSSVTLWWKQNSYKYPRLARIARQYLSIPGTSATSERVFSTAGLTVTKLRNSLKPSHVNSLVFLNKNLKLMS